MGQSLSPQTFAFLGYSVVFRVEFEYFRWGMHSCDPSADIVFTGYLALKTFEFDFRDGLGNVINKGLVCFT